MACATPAGGYAQVTGRKATAAHGKTTRVTVCIPNLANRHRRRFVGPYRGVADSGGVPPGDRTSNSCALTPATKASHSAFVKSNTGPSGWSESRMAIPPAMGVTSTWLAEPGSPAECHVAFAR